MLKMFISWFRGNPDPQQLIDCWCLEDHASQWFRTMQASGMPKYLIWRQFEVLSQKPVIVKTNRGDFMAYLPVRVQLEPEADSPMQEILQAGEPRNVLACFQ